jgi:hypothetical protein
LTTAYDKNAKIVTVLQKFRKTIPATHIEYKEGNCSKESNFFLYCTGARTNIWLVMRNTFSVEGVFLAESQYV